MANHSSLKHESMPPRRSAVGPEHPSADAVSPAHPLVALQRQVGNAQVARMLAQREGAAPEEEDELQLSRDPAVQRESAPEEEDELQLSRDPAVQRASATDEDELQLAREAPEVGPEGGPVSDATASRINAMRGGGSSLDQGARAEMEAGLGDSLADVRVHTGAESQQLNRSLGARAFTTGSDIFFGEGASPADKGLLGHELTHVVQQRGMEGGGPMTVGPADDAYEAQAEAAGSALSSGAAPSAQRAPEQEQQG
jgi:hypothetical protein